MKLRIQGNALRLRLSQSEVARFSEHGRIEDAIDFGGNARFTYSLERASDASSPKAFYQDGTLRVHIPRAEADDWVATDREGVYGGDHVSIAVEKDYKCMHGDDKDSADAFPNPLESAGIVE